MARRKREDHFVRSLNKISGNSSYGLTLPIDVVRRFRWKRRQKLQITVNDRRKEIVIRDWKK
jgi:hypothetical protein